MKSCFLDYSIAYCSSEDPRFPISSIQSATIRSSGWQSDANPLYPVYFVVERGLFIGTSETEFSPKATMNRGMLATVLYRMAGEPEVQFSPIFGDVKEGSWYAPGVIWAAQSGVISSETEDCKPLENLTRQEIAVMLYNYATWRGIDTSERGDLSGMSDSDQISEWALDAMSWNVAKGIFIGTGESIKPLDTTNRAEVATVLMRFDALFSQ